MGNIITYNDIVKADVNNQLKKLNELLLQTDKSIKSIKETGSSGKGLKEVTDQLQKQVTSTTQLDTISKKRLQTEKLLIKEENKRIKNAEKFNIQLQQKKANEQALANEIRKEAREVAVLAREEKQILVLRNKEIKSDKELIRLNAMMIRQRSNMVVKTRQEKKAYKELTREIVRNEKQIRRADKSIGRFQRNVGNYASSLKGLGRTLFAGFGLLGFIRLLKNAGNTFKTFEKDVKRLQAIIGSDKNISQLTQQAKDLGGTTVFTANQIVGLQTELAKLGFTVSEIVSSTTGIQALAAATGIELAEAATIAGSALNIFGLDASESARVADVLALSTSKSALDMQKLATALPIVGTTARIAGQSLERTTALLSVLADRGMDASTSATALRNIFLQLSKKGITWEDALTRINNASDKNNESLKIFGVRSAAAGVILAENTESVKELEEAYIAADNAAQDMADTMVDNLAGDITLAKSAWEGFILSVEDGDGAISLAVRGIVKSFTFILQKLTEFNKFGNIIGEQDAKIISQRIEKFKEEAKDLTRAQKERKLKGHLLFLEEKILKTRKEFDSLPRKALPFKTKEWKLINARIKAYKRERDILIQLGKTGFLEEKEDATKEIIILQTEEEKRLKALLELERQRNKTLRDRKKIIKEDIPEILTGEAGGRSGRGGEASTTQQEGGQIAADTAEEMINRVEEVFEKQVKKKPSFLSRLLGVDDETISRIKSQASEIFNTAFNLIAESLSIERQANDERLSMADERIAKTSEELKAERDRLKEIQEKGQATHSALEKNLLKRLASEKQAKEAALAQDKVLKKKQKRLDIISAQINTFQSISNALSIKPVWLGIIMAAVMGGLGLVQVRNIQNTKYAEGTRYLHLNGNRAGRDTIPAIGNDGSHIMLDEGERILSRKQNARIDQNFPNELIPEAIQFYKEGGGPTNIIGDTDNNLLRGIYNNTKDNGIEHDEKGRITKTPTMNITYA